MRDTNNETIIIVEVWEIESRDHSVEVLSKTSKNIVINPLMIKNWIRPALDTRDRCFLPIVDFGQIKWKNVE